MSQVAHVKENLAVLGVPKTDPALLRMLAE
jgi:hypothetical protein